MIHLVLGGARSGKSSFAESCVLQHAKNEATKPFYIATAIAFDVEMKKRIAMHQFDRADDWQVTECPYTLSQFLTSLSSQQVVLVDCLTLWLNNLIYDKEQQLMQSEVDSENRSELIEQHVKASIEELILSLSKQANQHITLVSNEVGLGVIPMGESTRIFVDHCGWLNQAIAKIADKVTLVTAGIPMQIKSPDKCLEKVL